MKNAKWWAGLLAAAAVAAFGLPGSAAADSQTVDGVEWSYAVYNGGEATVTGAAPAAGDLVIPAELGGYPVRIVGGAAFDGCSELVSVAMSSVRVIEDYAFHDCTALESVSLGNRIEELNWGVFNGCDSLLELTLPESVTYLGWRRASAFDGCSLEKLYVPASWEGVESPLTSEGDLFVYMIGEPEIVYYGGGNPEPVPGAEWYVDASVRVSGDGKSREGAFKTLAEGMAAAGGADFESGWATVWLAPGRYDGDVDYAIAYGFKGAIRGLGTAEETVIAGSPENETVAITGLSDVTWIDGRGSLGEMWSDTEIVVERCVIRGWFEDMGEKPLIWCREIRDCLLAGNTREGTAMPLVVCARVVGSTLVGNRASGSAVSGTNVVLNSILWDNRDWSSGKLGNYAAEEKGYWDEEAEEWVVTGTAYTTLSNCCVNPDSMHGGYDDETGEDLGGMADPRSGLSVVFADPRFADAAAGDYRLAAGSPCIDAGSSAWVEADETDLDGRTRTAGKAPDIGCYESDGESGGEATATTPVAVPHAWLEESAASILAANGGDHEAAANAAAANGMPVWACYVAGLSPTDAAAAFRVKSISFVDGEPVVEWDPDLDGTGAEAARAYTVEGKRSMEDEWGEMDAESRFFRVRAEMP